MRDERESERQQAFENRHRQSCSTRFYDPCDCGINLIERGFPFTLGVLELKIDDLENEAVPLAKLTG